MHFYSYGSQNYHDVGWGCVYRSMQNVQSATGRHVNTVPELLHAAHKQRGEWAEPGLFLHMYPGAQASSAGTVHPLHSRPSLYTRATVRPAEAVAVAAVAVAEAAGACGDAPAAMSARSTAACPAPISAGDEAGAAAREKTGMRSK